MEVSGRTGYQTKPGTSGSWVRRSTDCAMRPGEQLSETTTMNTFVLICGSFMFSTSLSATDPIAYKDCIIRGVNATKAYMYRIIMYLADTTVLR